MIFDLDGTLVDSVPSHVMAWQRAFAEHDLPVDAWRIHRRIGMNGKLLMRHVALEIGKTISTRDMERLDKRHAVLFREIAPQPRPLNGALELLERLKAHKCKRGIATSGSREGIESSLEALEIGKDVKVVDGDAVANAKPEPDLFTACRERLRAKPHDALVVGDSTWDILAARRAGILAVGLLCGGTSCAELYQAGALRVYEGPGELGAALDELGFT